jgi:hypothetical protein
LNTNEIILNSTSSTATATSTVGVPGAGTYTLAYTLANSENPPNAFRSVISAYSGTTFTDVILEDASDYGVFGFTRRSFSFTIPADTTGIRLTFRSLGVST